MGISHLLGHRLGLADVLDLAVLVLLGLAVVHGWRRRGSRLAGHWTGLVLGAAVGTALAAHLTRGWPAHRLVVVLALVLGGLLVGGALGARTGRLLARLLRRLGLAGADRVVGATLAAVVVLAGCAPALGVLAEGHGRWANAAAESSTVQADRRLPEKTGNVAAHLADRSGLSTLPALLGRPVGTDR